MDGLAAAVAAWARYMQQLQHAEQQVSLNSWQQLFRGWLLRIEHVQQRMQHRKQLGMLWWWRNHGRLVIWCGVQERRYTSGMQHDALQAV